MEHSGQFRLSDLKERTPVSLPQGGRIEKRVFIDTYGMELTVLYIDNGLMAVTVLPDRGMEIGEFRLAGETMSWDRSLELLLHPAQVDLHARNGTGWLDGFYSAAAAIGPELFGTPGEGYTLHGTASYSPAKPDSVFVRCNEEGIEIKGIVACIGYGTEPVFEKEIVIRTGWSTSVLLREETTVNLTDTAQTLDDGYHVQLSGSFLHNGGRYVLPVSARNMLLRDGAVAEDDPLRIPAREEGPQPIRCYQYVPKPVSGMENINELASWLAKLHHQIGVTAEMVVNNANSAAGFVIRPLDCFPRSLIAKEIGEAFMFSFEPCRTRPNRMSQKHTDGEAFVLPPRSRAFSQCIMGVTRSEATISALEQAIHDSIN